MVPGHRDVSSTRAWVHTVSLARVNDREEPRTDCGDVLGRPDFGGSRFGITVATTHPPYVYSSNGMGRLIHRVARVDLHWYDCKGDWLRRRSSPKMIAVTVCGNYRHLTSTRRLKARTCAVPAPDAVLCGRCHGQTANFPHRDPTSKRRALEAKRKLGCIVAVK